MNIFKINFFWWEDYGKNLLAKDVTIDEFEKDLIQAKNYAQSLIGFEDDENAIEKYSVECLPEYYDKIIWFLTKKLNYFLCNFDKDKTYYVEEDDKKILILRKDRVFTRNEVS